MMSRSGWLGYKGLHVRGTVQTEGGPLLLAVASRPVAKQFDIASNLL
jgi:hypothetical protein